MTDITEPVVLADAAAWRAWLDANEDTHDGLWLRLAKKGTTEPTSLSYDQALDEALCSGWIDGQKKSFDASTFQQRFTPRRKASMWSQRNVGLVAGLIAEGRMRPRGLAEIERAQGDGRWDRAYPGSKDITVPEDLAAILASNAAAATTFAGLNSVNRFAVLFRLHTAPSEASRQNRLTSLVAMLEAGQTPYPQ